MSSTHSPAWSKLVALDERSRSPETPSEAAASSGNPQQHGSAADQETSLIILDLENVPNWKLGQEAGRKLTQSARQMALTRLESGVIDATAPPVLSKLYLVLLANTEFFNDEQLSTMQDFMLGFNEPGRSELERSVLSFGLTVPSAPAQTAKVEDLIRLLQPGMHHLVLSSRISEGSNLFPEYHELDLSKATAEDKLSNDFSSAQCAQAPMMVDQDDASDTDVQTDSGDDEDEHRQEHEHEAVTAKSVEKGRATKDENKKAKASVVQWRPIVRTETRSQRRPSYGYALLPAEDESESSLAAKWSGVLPGSKRQRRWEQNRREII